VTRPVDASFPACTWPAHRPLWRVHRTGHGPWWFSADGRGRFDPVGIPGIGACYLAQEPLGAFIEVFRTRLLLDVDDIERMAMARLEVGRGLRIADLGSRRALGYGLTAEVGAGGDYGLSQAFASASAAAGFDGVRWWVRNDPAQRLVGVALFAPVGVPDDVSQWPRGDSRPLGEDLLGEARRKFGYRVLPRP
jgi:hypothetical protein